MHQMLLMRLMRHAAKQARQPAASSQQQTGSSQQQQQAAAISSSSSSQRQPAAASQQPAKTKMRNKTKNSYKQFQACHKKIKSKSCFPFSSVQVLGPSWEPSWNQVGTKIRKNRIPKNHQKMTKKKSHRGPAMNRCCGPLKYYKPRFPRDRRTI